ncbi:MAG: cell division protein FtsQ/DivIB [Rickettsiales bacterium]|jgi:cell division septal protein FtsQ|nr:cell division protein FtsQ/DivIB [Rickettsiales bacterium]
MTSNKPVLWLCAIATLIAAGYACIRGIMISAGLTGAAPIRSILIMPAPKTITSDKVVGKLGIKKGSSVYDIDLNTLASAAISLPEISRARAKRFPNGRIVLLIEELKPIAFWTDGRDIYPMASNGAIVRIPVKKFNGLLFEGLRPTDAEIIIRAFAKFPDLNPFIRSVELIETRRYNINIKGGGRVLLGEDLDKSLARLSALQKSDKILGKKLKTLDLRDSARTLVSQ